MTAGAGRRPDDATGVRWINTPCTDPLGRVFLAGDKVCRAIFPGREGVARSVIDNPVVHALMEEGLIARMQVSGQKMAGFNLVVETERAPFDVPCDRFTRATLRAAALGWLETSRRLLPAGLALSDAHFGNYMLFGNNQPRWVDLGSIRPPSEVEEEKPFRSFARFWSGMVAPLALVETQPHHARLARLSMADQPYQGPCAAAAEAPLSVDALVDDLRKQVVAEVGALGAEQALDRLSAFVTRLPHAVEPASRRDEKPATAVIQYVGEQCATSRAASVACLGTEAFRHLAGFRGKADVVVIGEVESELDRLERDGDGKEGGGQLALYYAHPVNRLFLRNPPAADAVLAVDPLARYAHSSRVEADNIGYILGSLGRKLAIVVTAAGLRDRTEHMLRQEYPSVSTETFSWFGRGPAVVIGKR